MVLRKCQLGRDGVLHIIEALPGKPLNHFCCSFIVSKTATTRWLCCFRLSDYSCLEELDLADNITELDHQECINLNLSGVCNHLEVADSEDEETPSSVEGTASGIDDSCASSCRTNSSSPKCNFTKQLSIAISKARSLELLDLSNNGFSAQAAEAFYGSWKTLRPLSSQQHITEKIIHLSRKEKRCCGVKPCCKKD